jgi:hypothetical protein
VVGEVQKEEPKLEIARKKRANHPITFLFHIAIYSQNGLNFIPDDCHFNNITKR